MRVGFLTHGIFPYHLGGMQRHSTNLANALSGLGLEVEVIHPGAPAGGEEAPAGTFAFSEVIVPWPDDLQYIPASWFFARRIAEVIEERDYDVLYGQGFTLWAYLGRRKRLPTIFNPHGLEMYASVGVEDTLKALPFRFMVRYHARRADRTISLGGKLTEILRERVGVPPERIAVIPNGVDPDYFERAADTAKEPNALFFIGRFAFNKGILPLIEAFNELRDTPVRLYVAGGGKLEARARALCRNDNVTFLGRISDEALKSWYRRCEAYILPSLYEGMPTVILEAMANGLPIIATDIGAVRTMVDEENGIVIPPGSPAAIADAVRHLFVTCSAEERRRMGEVSYQRVRAAFTWEQIARRTRDLLEELRERKEEPRAS